MIRNYFTFALGLAFAAVFSLTDGNAGEVSSVCGHAEVKVLDLQFRSGPSNFKIILGSNLGRTPLAEALHTYFSAQTYPIEMSVMQAFVRSTNLKFAEAGSLKELFAKYSTEGGRVNNPAEFRFALIDAVRNYVPAEFGSIDWLLQLKSSKIVRTGFRAPLQDELFEEFGAQTVFEKTGEGKYKLEVIYSTRESETVPYLMTLIAHELVHAKSFEEKIKIMDDDRLYTEYLLVEEAKAFDLQLRLYIALAKRFPIFCDWLSTGWRLGEIPAPLSWGMAEMERDLDSGRLLVEYTKLGTYKNHKFLLNKAGNDLSLEIKNKIKKLHLKFVSLKVP